MDGQAFAVQPVLEVRDAGQNLVDGAQVAATIETGGGTLGGTTQTQAKNGVAKFIDLAISGAPGSRTLRFTAASASVVSAAVAITPTQQGDLGAWTAPFDWPVVAVHLHLMRGGQVLSFGLKRTPLVWDISTGVFTEVPSATLVFCSGHALLPDGRLLVTGGHILHDRGLPDVNIFDPATRAWIPVAPMAQGRWYPSTTVLANGDMLTVGGADSSATMVTVPEVWNGSSWRRLIGANLSLPYYPWLFQAPNGKVFYAGHAKATYYLDTQGNGAWTLVANSNYGEREFGSAVMYEPGKVLIVGGGGFLSSALPTNTAETIDLNDAAPTWKSTGSMAFRRRHVTATLLPTGDVLVTGGTAGPGMNDVPGSVHQAEIWNPTTGAWKTLAANAIDRIYHSTAILLPDARVLVAGSGERATNTDELNAEIFSPPYLFRGPRPTLGNTPAAIQYGSSFSVSTPDGGSIAKVTLVRPGSVTHAINMSQRYMSLPFTVSTGGLSVTAPASGNLAPPGDYLLFLVNSDGVPSVGRFVNLR
jgi:galactose oxidase